MTGSSTEPTSIGRYELSSTLGIGGFAAVYRAYDPALDGDVAIKILLPQFVDNDDIRNRFLQEARLLRRVDSPSLIRVYDIGELADEPDGLSGTHQGGNRRPYFVMELADGGVVGDRRRGPVDPASMASVVEALVDGLGALHAANVVHRDIKPDNLLVAGSAKSANTEVGGALLTEGERVLIGDLGLAKDQDRTTAGPTVAGGTPFYRPPEQMTHGAPITPAADVYAATGVLWFLLTGSHPPDTDAVPAQVTSMPAAWQPVLERGLDADPTLRHATIAEWGAEALAAIADGPDSGVGTVQIGVSADLCPYKGLAAFQPEDAGLYFGRDDMIDSLVARMQDHPVLVIGGASGSGKSSLMRAGLIPRLGRGAIAGSQQWRVALFTPGSDAVGELVHQLRRLRPDAAAQGDAPLAAADLPHGARRWLDDGPSTLLAIDQFEELFTLNPSRADQELFLETLASMTESAHSKIKVAVALRADFYGVCAGFPWLSERINEGQFLVGPMSRQELRDAITIPARRAGLALEEGLVDTILDDVGGGGTASGGALPLLGHALMETWIRRRGSRMTLDGYRGAGGVTGAIAQRAEEIFTQLSADEQESARRLLLQLINPGQGTPDTRRRVQREALGAHADLTAVLEKLASARLLTVDADVVEVAHEALIQSWPRLRTWIDENRENLQARRRITTAAAEWDAQDRSPDLLYRGAQLAGGLEWLDAHPDELDDVGCAFLRTARDQRDAAEREQQAREARGRRNRRTAISALAVLAAAAVVASGVAFVALGRSRSNQRAAEAQQVQALAAAAAANATEQPLLATGLALESIARGDPSTAAARAALVEARVGLDNDRLSPQTFGHPVVVGDMLVVAITPDGERFVTGGRNGEVVFWDRVTRTETHRMEDVHDPGTTGLAISNDGRWLVTTGRWKAFLWDLGADAPEPTLLHQMTEVGGTTMWDVAFSEDGSLVGIATEGEGVLVFERSSRTMVSSGLSDRGLDLLSVAFLDNEQVAVGDGAGDLYVVSTADGSPIGDVLIAGDDGTDLWELVPNRAQNLLLTTGNDHTVKSWRIEPDGLVPEAVLADDAIRYPAGLLPIRDGAEMVFGGADGRMHRADPATGDLIPDGASMEAHTDDVIDAAASANGWIVSLADDQRIQLWRSVGSAALVDDVLAEGDAMVDLALSPSASLLAVSTEAGVVVHDALTGDVLHRLGDGSASLAFVDDDRIVTGSDSGLLQLWDVVLGELIAENAGHSAGPIRAMSASADGRVVASGGADGAVILWSGEDLEKIRDLPSHNGEVTGIDFTTDDETVVTVGWDQVMRFSAVDGDDAQSFPLAQDGPQTVEVHPREELVAVGGSKERIDVIDFDGNLLRSMAPHGGGVWDTAITADGLSVVGTSRLTGELQLWDWMTGDRLGPAFGDTYGRREPDVAVDTNGVVWSSGLDGMIRRLDVLDERVGCEISQNVMDARMSEQFLSGDDLQSCQ